MFGAYGTIIPFNATPFDHRKSANRSTRSIVSSAPRPIDYPPTSVAEIPASFLSMGEGNHLANSLTDIGALKTSE